MSWSVIDTGPSDSWTPVTRPTTIAVSGVSGTTIVRDIEPGIPKSLSGVSISGSVGNLDNVQQDAPSAVSATGSAGTPTAFATPFVTVTPTAVSATGSVTTFARQTLKQLTGALLQGLRDRLGPYL